MQKEPLQILAQFDELTITIPDEFIELYNIQPGDNLYLSKKEEGILIQTTEMVSA